MPSPPAPASSSAPFTVACLQVNAGTDMAANIAAAVDLARQARKAGADLILMPENVSMMTWGRESILANAHTEADHPALAAFQDLARELGVWLHAGSLTIRPKAEATAHLSHPEAAPLVNRTLVLDPQGRIRARYDKIHMFDVDLGGGERYRESETFRPGDRAVTVATPHGTLGLSICYDLRFPHLYRALAQAGATVLAVPAAFTRKTGQAHWHTLLQARAIETGCYVVAPAQTGRHAGDRETYGHALVVDPWGAVIADAGAEGPGVITARIDPDRVAEARRMIPALNNDRPFQVEQA